MIRYANIKDFDFLNYHDKHISAQELKNAIYQNRILIMYIENKFIGWMRYNLFWDNTPFINMLYILEDYRGKGYGTLLMNFLEKEMSEKKLQYHFNIHAVKRTGTVFL